MDDLCCISIDYMEAEIKISPVKRHEKEGRWRKLRLKVIVTDLRWMISED
jgi:hypothetical protein